MKKIRLTRTQTIEYIPDHNAYPGCETIEEMAELDLGNVQTDPCDFFCMAHHEEGVQESVTYEIVG